MAESKIISGAASAISSTINSLGTIAWNEIRFLNDVPSKVQSIEAKLRAIQSYLKDAENQPIKSHLTENWLREIKGLAYRAQDVIEKIVWLQRRRDQDRGCARVFSRYSHIPSYLRSLHEIVAEIDRINNFIPGITDTINNLNVVNIKEGSSATGKLEDPWSKDPRTSLHVNEEDEVVGFDSKIEEILKELLDSENKQLTVVSLVGMGGIGKSTLARKVCKHSDVRTHFDVNVGITVSKQYDVLSLQKQILKAASQIQIQIEDLEKMSSEQVKEKLVDSLKERKYLILIDDIWTIKSWDDINPHNTIFPNGNNGSRIILTTRNLDVGKNPEIRTLVHELKLLDHEKSWELLKKKAFPKYVTVSDEQRNQLECLGPQLAQNCRGLPLCLVVLGGYLSKHLDYQTWSMMSQTVDWIEAGNQIDISKILALSYHDLPNDLKPIFLYITAFPEDQIIESSDLIKLWIAEGFIPPSRKYKLETIGERYLDQLYQRGLVQIVQRDRIHERIIKIRIHDVMRDWGIERAQDEGFFSVIKNSDDANYCDARLLCRVVLHGYHDEDVANWVNARTFLGFELPENNLSLYGLNSLRVISFIRKEQGPQKLPKCIKKMIFLRYLCVKNCENIIFPSSIGQLSNLQILDCRQSQIVSLPNSLWGISSLRHVYLQWIECRWNGPKKGQGRNLQTLVISEGDFMNSQKIMSWKYTGMDAIGVAIEDMEQIVNLCLNSVRNSITWRRNILSKIYGFLHLEELTLDVGGLTRISDVSAFPPNLLKLILLCGGLAEDPIPVLEKLSKLVELHLYGEFFNDKLTRIHCSASGFPQLKYLKLSDFPLLKDWEVDVGAMSKLCHLKLELCQNLERFPEELMEHQQLQLVEIYRMTQLSKVDYSRLEENGCKVIHATSQRMDSIWPL